MRLFGWLPPQVERLHARRDVGGLIEALAWGETHKRPQVAEAAVRALGDLKDPRGAGPLRDRLMHCDCAATVEALAAIGAGEAVEPLMRLLSRSSAHRDLIVAALRRLGPDAVTRGVALARTFGDKAEVAALAALGGPDVVEPLIKQFTFADARNRDLIVRTLDECRDATIEPAARALEHDQAWMRKATAAVLERVGETDTVVPILVGRLEVEHEQDVIESIVVSLRARGWTPTTEFWRVLLIAVDQGWGVGVAGCPLDTVLTVADRTLYRIPELLVALHREDPTWPAHVAASLSLSVIGKGLGGTSMTADARDAAVAALGQIAVPEAADLLVPLAFSRGSDVCEAAGATLRRLGAHAAPALVRAVVEGNDIGAPQLLVEIGPPAVAALVAALPGNPRAKLLAQLLGRIGDPQAITSLAQAFRTCGTEHYYAIAHALVDIGGPASMDALAVVARNDRDRMAQREALAVLIEARDVRVVGPLLRILRADPRRSNRDARDIYRAVAGLKAVLPGREAVVSVSDLRALETLPDQTVSETVSSDYSWDTGTYQSETLDLEWARAWARRALAERLSTRRPVDSPNER